MRLVDVGVLLVALTAMPSMPDGVGTASDERRAE
jgi:hypothetical protein